jgi:hypothetical protein
MNGPDMTNPAPRCSAGAGLKMRMPFASGSEHKNNTRTPAGHAQTGLTARSARAYARQALRRVGGLHHG